MEVTRSELQAAGIMLLVSVAFTLVASAMPVWAVFVASPEQQVEIVSGARGPWLASVTAWSLAFIAGAAGIAMLCAVFARGNSPTARSLAVAGAVIFGFGSMLWTVATLIQGSVLAELALDPAASSIDWLTFAQVQHAALWLIASIAFTFAAILLAITVWRSAILARWNTWPLVGFAVIAAAFIVITQDLPPFALFLLMLPFLGIACLRRAALLPPSA